MYFHFAKFNCNLSKMVVTSSQFESMTPSGSMPAGPSYLLPSSLGRSEFHSSFLGRIKIKETD